MKHQKWRKRTRNEAAHVSFATERISLYIAAIPSKPRFEMHYVRHTKHPFMKINSTIGGRKGLLRRINALNVYFPFFPINHSRGCAFGGSRPFHATSRAPAGPNRTWSCWESSSATYRRVSTDWTARPKQITFPSLRNSTEAEGRIRPKYCFTQQILQLSNFTFYCKGCYDSFTVDSYLNITLVPSSVLRNIHHCNFSLFII